MPAANTQRGLIIRTAGHAPKKLQTGACSMQASQPPPAALHYTHLTIEQALQQLRPVATPTWQLHCPDKDCCTCGCCTKKDSVQRDHDSLAAVKIPCKVCTAILIIGWLLCTRPQPALLCSLDKSAIRVAWDPVNIAVPLAAECCLGITLQEKQTPQHDTTYQQLPGSG